MVDLGTLLGLGRRPSPPADAAPLELVELVWRFGMRLTEVANNMGVSSRTVQRWWRGKSAPQERRLRQLAEILGVRRLSVDGQVRGGARQYRGGT